MKVLFLLIFTILISFILADGKKMECSIINRTYEDCSWVTKSTCCYLEASCKMGVKVNHCQRRFHWKETELKNYIKKSLEKEWGNEKEKEK